MRASEQLAACDAELHHWRVSSWPATIILMIKVHCLGPPCCGQDVRPHSNGFLAVYETPTTHN